MIEKDYILRKIQRFFEVLFWFLSKEKDKENMRKGIKEIYITFLSRDRGFFIYKNTDELITYLSKQKTAHQDIEILANLFYRDGQLNNSKELLEKSIQLFEYIQKNDNTFSIDRTRKINEIKDLLFL